MPAIAQLTSIGVGKETTFGVGVVPTIFPGYETWSPTPKNTGIARPDTRKRLGRSMHATGPYDFSASLRPSSQPDVLFPLLAWAFGSQTAPALAQFYSTLTTGSLAVGSNVAIPVTAGSGTSNPGLAVGQSITVDLGGANQEVCTITALAANSITVSAITKTHTTGVAIAGYSTTAYASTLSFGQSLPSFTTEYNRNSSGATAVDYLGCTVDTLKMSCSPGKEATFDFGIVAASELINASPTAPSFSSLFPLVNEAPLSYYGQNSLLGAVVYKGAVLPGVVLRQWDVSLSNKLDKSYRTAASRFVQGFPIGQREASGSLKLSFSSDTMYSDFLGATGATSPQTSITGVSLVITVASQSLADATRIVPWSVTLNLPSLFLNGDAVPGAQSNALDQTLSFDALETPGANNDLTLGLVGTASAVY